MIQSDWLYNNSIATYVKLYILFAIIWGCAAAPPELYLPYSVIKSKYKSKHYFYINYTYLSATFTR